MNESTETFLRMEAIFHEALATPPESRLGLIATRCAGDTLLMAEIHSLLDASEMEEHLSASRRAEQNSNETPLERQQVGPYKIDRLLGRGGMGAVYLAHRADGQFEQQVAIKLIDLPLATDFFRERFRQERQILAGLQHPFIARLLDGGVTPAGDLYLAMEYVDGVPIHRFCDRKNLSIAERLALFRNVCEAVQFAHQNLVVHRDLKPDNILVAEDGTPRLLDFGTAKLVSPSLEKQAGDLTRQGYQSFTPQYASPEQVLGHPITTASDTYSLGILLYLLLTGSLPYEMKEMTLTELIRVICEEPPRKPAHAVNSKERLDADLEAILSKALRKQPTERYRTAEQLSTDILDYLEGRPVAARRGSFRYRTAKFIRRNRLALAGAAVLAASLVAGVAGVLWQARVANEERRKAEARSSDLRQLSNSLLSELDEAIKQLPGSTGVQKILVTRVLEHLDRMAKDAKGDRLIQLDLVDAYTRLGNLQGNPYDQNLGDPTGALTSLGKALAIGEPLAAPNDPEALRALATAQDARSEILFGDGRTVEAIASQRAAVQTYDRLIADPKTPPPLIGEAAAAYGTLGDELGQSGTASLADTTAALAAFRQAIALDNCALSIDPKFPRARRGLSIMQMKVGNVELEYDPAQALRDFQLALERAEDLPPADQKSLVNMRMHAMLLRKKANSLSALGRYSEATPLFEQVVQVQQKLAEQDPQDLRALADLEVIHDDEALSLVDAANPVLSSASPADRHQYLLRAEDLFNRAVLDLAPMLKRDPANEIWRSALASAQVAIATIRSREHLPGEVDGLARQGLATFRELAENPKATVMILDEAADAFLNVQPAAFQDRKFALNCAERAADLSHRKRAALLLSLAQAYHANGQMDQARATAREALAMLPASQPSTIQSRIRKLLEIEARAS